MINANLPEPKFIQEDMFRTIVYRQVSEQVTEQVTEQVKRLLHSMKESMSIKNMMGKLMLKHRPSFLYDYLHPAINRGLIEMTQPDSPKSPTQKYRLTKKGLALKSRIK